MRLFGSDEYKKKMLLAAKELLHVIKDNPGLCSDELYKRVSVKRRDLFNILQSHKLIYKKQPLNTDGRRPELWYATGYQPSGI